MKVNFLWWIALIVAICGVLMFEGFLRISNFSSFWTEVIAAGLFAIAAFFSGK